MFNFIESFCFLVSTDSLSASAMVVDKLVSFGRSTVEIVFGGAKTLVSPNEPIPATKLHPRMPPRPFTGAEWFRMLSWRYMWRYQPVLRYYVFSVCIVLGVFKFLVPLKPRHKIMYNKGKDDSHHHEIEHWAGFRQKEQDKLYFKKYAPAGTPVLEGHH
ncbi:Protein CBR-RIL-1 [Aphelenchoides bicaudatus]|nr:Protein CBR-RIL-1 [Aphelenchoides bicaudatus]